MTRLRTVMRLALLLSASACMGPVGADIRIVVTFDADGHRVVRSRAAEPAPAKLLGRSMRQLRAKSVPARADDGRVSLRWLDAAGDVVGVERIADPRVAHFPGQSGKSGDARDVRPAGRVAMSSGALMLRGPGTAMALVIALPAVDTPFLAAETWWFDLRAGTGFQSR